MYLTQIMKLRSEKKVLFRGNDIPKRGNSFIAYEILKCFIVYLTEFPLQQEKLLKRQQRKKQQRAWNPIKLKLLFVCAT